MADSRIESLLENWLGANNEVLPPVSNIERILQNIIGIPDVEILPIQSRNEALLLQILEEGAGAGGDWIGLIDGSLSGDIVVKGVTSIRNYAFNGTNIENVTVSSGVTSVGKYAFGSCKKLETIKFGEGLTNIDQYCFEQSPSNTLLESVELPSTITQIGNYAFSNCKKLKTLTVKAITPPTIGANTFNNVTAMTNIYVPAASVDLYKSTTNWSSKASIITAIPE